MKTLGVIPARMASRRFPGKPLALLGGRPLVWHVWEAARRAGSVTRLVLATESSALAAAARGFGAEVVLTGEDCRTGTDRAAQALEALGEPFDTVVNLQGDEPLLVPETIDEVVAVLASDPDASAATLAFEDGDPAAFTSPHVVKVVRSPRGHALYFSRAPIGPAPGSPAGKTFLHHVGIYALRSEALRAFASWPESPLERAEGLEQLRLLEHGFRMRVSVTSYRSRGVDTPEDLAALEHDRQSLVAPGGGSTPAPGEARS